MKPENLFKFSVVESSVCSVYIIQRYKPPIPPTWKHFISSIHREQSFFFSNVAPSASPSARHKQIRRSWNQPVRLLAAYALEMVFVLQDIDHMTDKGSATSVVVLMLDK
jgi:hypothetical protein